MQKPNKLFIAWQLIAKIVLRQLFLFDGTDSSTNVPFSKYGEYRACLCKLNFFVIIFSAVGEPN